jgi:hypothetical protein
VLLCAESYGLLLERLSEHLTDYLVRVHSGDLNEPYFDFATVGMDDAAKI